jgi:taurine dioxygenase
MTFEIRPLGDALGAEIIGLDLSAPVDESTFAKVHQAHLDHLVLVFRDQRLDPQHQIDFSRRFGPLDHHPSDDAVLPDFPDVLVLSTKRENGKYIGLPDAGPMWHSDLAYRKQTALGTTLYALETPDSGGDTRFANMYKAYEALPKNLKDAVAGKRAVFLQTDPQPDAARRHPRHGPPRHPNASGNRSEIDFCQRPAHHRHRGYAGGRIGGTSGGDFRARRPRRIRLYA